MRQRWFRTFALKIRKQNCIHAQNFLDVAKYSLNKLIREDLFRRFQRLQWDEVILSESENDQHAVTPHIHNVFHKVDIASLFLKNFLYDIDSMSESLHYSAREIVPHSFPRTCNFELLSRQNSPNSGLNFDQRSVSSFKDSVRDG